MWDEENKEAPEAAPTTPALTSSRKPRGCPQRLCLLIQPPRKKCKAEMTFARSQHARIKKVGICATESGRRFMCNSCGATFSEGRSMPPGGRSLDFGKPVQAMSRLVTGRSDYSPS